MGREIEMKVPLSQNDFLRLYNYFCGFYAAGKIDSFKLIFKTDEYFSRYSTDKERIENNEPQVIRLRTESEDSENLCRPQDSFEQLEELIEERKNASAGRNSFFTLKRKTIENGIEINREDETYVENAEPLRQLFKETSFINYFNKSKTSAGAVVCFPEISEEAFHVELVKVNSLLYCETEYTGNALQTEEAVVLLEKVFAALGLDSSRKDERSWRTITQELLNQ